MSTTYTDLPTPQQIDELRQEDAEASAAWYRGEAAATRHAGVASIIDPTRSVLSDPDYCARMGDSAWADRDRHSACYWYGYAAKAIRLDPDGGRAIAG